jgi:hypothetical protein
MANILTAPEAANFLRSTADDAVMLQFLPLVDQYLQQATGHDWAADAEVHDTAKLAAGMLLTYWYDNPGMVGQAPGTLSGSLVALEAEALKYRKYEFEGMNGAGSISLPGARTGDDVIKLVGVYGVTGDQSGKFEATISVDDQIQQTDAGDLSENQYVVVLKHPADDVSA